MSETVAFLCKRNAGFARLTRYVFVTVQHDLSGKRRVPADFDGEVAPVRIEDMKRVMIDIGHGLLSLDVVVGADVPNRRLSATDENEKQPSGDLRLGQVFFRDIVLPFPH